MLENNGAPLQTAIKTQFSYDSVSHRVSELCNAFRVRISSQFLFYLTNELGRLKRQCASTSWSRLIYTKL